MGYSIDQADVKFMRLVSSFRAFYLASVLFYCPIWRHWNYSKYSLFNTNHNFSNSTSILRHSTTIYIKKI